MAETIDLGKVVGPPGPQGPKGDPGTVEIIDGNSQPTNTIMSGKKVYSKAYGLSNLKSKSITAIDLNIGDFEYVWIDLQNSMVYSSRSCYPASYYDGSSYLSCYIDRTSKQLKVVTSGDWSGFTAYINVRYY